MLYADANDVIKAYGGSEYVSTTNTGWRDHKDTELVECINDVSGNMNNEPEILVAMRDGAGKVNVFGIDTIFGYM